MEAERTTDLALAELRSQQVAKVEEAVNAAKKEARLQYEGELSELKRLLAQARERVVESASLRQTIESSEKIKSAMLDDKEDTIRSLKEKLADAEKKLLKMGDYRDQRDEFKHDLRRAEDRETEMAEKNNSC